MFSNNFIFDLLKHDLEGSPFGRPVSTNISIHNIQSLHCPHTLILKAQRPSPPSDSLHKK